MSNHFFRRLRDDPVGLATPGPVVREDGGERLDEIVVEVFGSGRRRDDAVGFGD
jgi:hypothetical protein